MQHEQTPKTAPTKAGSVSREVKAGMSPRVQHGLSETRAYWAWDNMRQRCHNPNHPKYPRYGKRGIRVCTRWRTSFLAFLEDMGQPPEGHSLERRDPKGHYTPENCCWATSAVQAVNRLNTVPYPYDGRNLTLPEWSRELHIPFNTLYKRVRILDWPIEKALETPVRKVGTA